MVKGLFAAIVAFGALIVMAVFAASWFRAEPSTFLDGLFFADGLLAFILAAAATLVSMLALIAVFAAFAIEEEPGHRRPAKPFSLLILLVALGLVFAAFWRAPPPPPPAPPAPAEPAPQAEPPPPEPIVEPVSGALIDDVLAPTVSAASAGYSFAYAYPAIAGAGSARAGAPLAALDQVFSATEAPGRVRLCGRAFVAFAGAASEEGPRDRNDARARARALIAIDRAARWLERQGADCVRPQLLGVDLGQHAPTGRAEGEGALTGYQREVIAIARDSAGATDRPDAAAALAELEAFLATPAGAAAVNDGRTFRRAPVAFIP